MAETLKRAQPFGLNDIDLRLPGEGEVFFERGAVDNPNAFALFQRQGRGFKRLGFGDSATRDEQIANLRKQGIDVNIRPGGGASIQGKALQGFNLSDIRRAGRDFFDIDPRGNLGIQNVQDSSAFDLTNFAPQPDVDLGRTGDALAAQATGTPFNVNQAMVSPTGAAGQAEQPQQQLQQPPQDQQALGQQPQQPEQPGAPVQAEQQPGLGLTPQQAIAAQGFQGPSVVDMLNTIGMDSSFQNRAQLAQRLGIQDYRGTAEQNTRMIQAIKQSSSGGGGFAQVPQTSQTLSTEIEAANEQQAAQEQAQRQLNEFGLAGAKPDVTDSPQSYFENTYKDLITSLGIPTIEENYSNLSKEYTEEVASVNDNPFLSEAQRSRQIVKLQDKFENRLMLQKDILDQAREEAKFIANNAMNAYYTERQFQADEAERLAQRAERQAKLLMEFEQPQQRDTITKRVTRGGREIEALFDKSTGEFIAELGEAPAGGAAGAGGGQFGFLTPVQGFDRELKIADTFRRVSGEAADAKRQLGQMEAGLAQAKASGDKESINAASQAVLVTFQKILDPTSVVRESEYARSGSGAALIDRMRGAITQLERGGAGLPLDSLEEFVDLGREFYKGYESTLAANAQIAVNQAQNLQGLTGGQFGNVQNILPGDILELIGQDAPIDDGLSDEDAYLQYQALISGGPSLVEEETFSPRLAFDGK